MTAFLAAFLGLITAATVAEVAAADSSADAPSLPSSPGSQKTTATDRYGDPLPAGAKLRLGTIRLRQKQGVEGVAFSPDGKLLASCGWDTAICIWDVATGQLVRKLIADEGDETLAVAFSPDGLMLASAGERGIVRIWNVGNGELVWKELGHVEEAGNGQSFGTRVYGVAFSPDGKTLATGGADPLIKLWDSATGKKIRELSAGDESGGNARPVAFSPDGSLLASANSQGSIFIWKADNGAQVQFIEKAHDRDIVSLIFTGDGKSVISTGQRIESTGDHSARFISQIRLWDVATGEQQPGFETPDDLSGAPTLAMSRDAKTLYSAHFDKIIIWDVESGFPTRYIRAEGAQLGLRTHGLAASPDGRLLASKGHFNRENKVWLWDLVERHEVFPQSDSHDAGVLAIQFSPDGSKIATGGADNTVRLWDAATGEQVRLVDQGAGWVRFVAFSPDGKLLMLGRETHEPKQLAFKGEIKVYNISDGNLIAEMAAPDRVMCGALSADGRVVAAALGLGGPIMPAGDPFGGAQPGGAKVIVWNATTGQQLASFDRGPAEASSLAFSPEGAELTLVSQDKSVQRWNWREGKEMPLANAPLPAGRSGFYKAVCTSDASKCVFGGTTRDGTKSTGKLSAFDLEKGTTLWENALDKERPWELAISPDGKLLAAYFKTTSQGKSPNRLAFFSMADGIELINIELPDDAVRSFNFSADGSQLAAGMELGDALVWDVTPAIVRLK